MPVKSKAFTLIELLVVVAIIVILIAILLPSLAKAREQARLVACCSNMKQTMIAVIMYAQENGNSLPPGSPWAANPPEDPYASNQYTGRIDNHGGYFYAYWKIGGNTNGYWRGLAYLCIEEYVPADEQLSIDNLSVYSSRIFSCPNKPAPTLWPEGYWNTNHGYAYIGGLCHGLTYTYTGTGDAGGYKKRDKLTDMPNAAIVFDYNGMDSYNRTTNHGELLPVGYLGGNVESVKPKWADWINYLWAKAIED